MKSTITTLVAFVVSLSVGVASAEIIFSESFTGADLFSDSRVSFPSRTPSLSGSSLLFDTGILGPGDAFAEKLFVLSLLPANTLSLFDPVVVDISMNLTVKQSDWPTAPEDHDPGAFVGDGNVLIGYMAAENFGGTIVVRVYSDEGDHAVMIDPLDILMGVGYPDIGESFDIIGRITLSPDSTEVYESFLGGSASHVFGQAIDRTQPFNFTFLAHDAQERYQMNRN